jgi:hypothetical protein
MHHFDKSREIRWCTFLGSFETYPGLSHNTIWNHDNDYPVSEGCDDDSRRYSSSIDQSPGILLRNVAFHPVLFFSPLSSRCRSTIHINQNTQGVLMGGISFSAITCFHLHRALNFLLCPPFCSLFNWFYFKTQDSRTQIWRLSPVARGRLYPGPFDFCIS